MRLRFELGGWRRTGDTGNGEFSTRQAAVGGRMQTMASNTQRFEVFQVVLAGKRAVFAAARHPMVDFHALCFLRRPPGPHRRLVSGRRRPSGLRGALGRGRAARAAAVLIAPFRGAARERPPVVRPERRRAPFAAPSPPARRQSDAAPGAALERGSGERTPRQQRRAFRRRLHDTRAIPRLTSTSRRQAK